MKSKNLVNFLLRHYPLALQDEWDESGVTNCCYLNNEINKCIICLDITNEVVNFAIKNKISLIISHHPIFKKKKNVINKIDKIILNKLKTKKISFLALHTCFDNSEKGMNFLLPKYLQVKHVKWFKNDSKNHFTLSQFTKATSITQLISIFQKKIKLEYFFTNVKNTKKKFSYLALCTGSGYSIFEKCFSNFNPKKTIFVTGDLKYHNWLTINKYKFDFLDAGHELENFFVSYLANLITKKFEKIKVFKFFSKKNKFLIKQ